VRHTLKIDAAEPAQHQAIFDTLFGFLEAPTVEVLADEHAQNDFDGRGMPPMHEREAIPGAQIGSHLSEQGFVFQQAVQFFEHRIGLSGQLWHARKDVFWIITVNEHNGSLLAYSSQWSSSDSMALL